MNIVIFKHVHVCTSVLIIQLEIQGVCGSFLCPKIRDEINSGKNNICSRFCQQHIQQINALDKAAVSALLLCIWMKKSTQVEQMVSGSCCSGSQRERERETQWLCPSCNRLFATVLDVGKIIIIKSATTTHKIT